MIMMMEDQSFRDNMNLELDKLHDFALSYTKP